MSAETLVPAASRTRLWISWVLSGLFIAFMLFDIGIKLSGMPIVAETQRALGWPVELTAFIAGLEAVLLALYVFPRTSVLGAVLFTALFGGTVATHLRTGDPLFSHVLFGVYLALFMWGGLWLREPRLRALFPLVSRH
jgi:hypothetical protein